MGIVYGAEDPALDRAVALKTIILSDEVEGRKNSTSGFSRAQGRGQAHPPNHHRLRFRRGGRPRYMAMELSRESSSRAKMLQGPIPVVEAVDIAEQVADGLAYAHERGVSSRHQAEQHHADAARQVKIMDFGSRACAWRSQDEHAAWARHAQYMSPEQWRVARRPPLRHLFARDRALRDASPAPRCSRARTRRRSCTTSSTSSTCRLPPESRGASMLDFVIARALKKDPRLRYQMPTSSPPTCGLASPSSRPRATADKDADATRTSRSRKARCGHGEDAARARGARDRSDTRLPLSRQFDSSVALRRLSAPTKATASCSQGLRGRSVSCGG